MSNVIDKELLDNFLADPSVVKQMQRYKRDNIFNIMDPTEVRHSRFLGWLFDPNEGHHSGDFFIKALLREVFSKSKGNIRCYGVEGEYSLLDVEVFSFQTSFISLEFNIPNSRRSIDIAIMDPVNELIIAVENKTGTKEQEKQTDDYGDGLEGLAKDLGWNVIFVYMDWYQAEAKDKKERWISIGYDWLADAIDLRLKDGVSDLRAESALRDYRDYIKEEDDCKVLATIAQDHAGFLRKFNASIDNKKSIGEGEVCRWKEDIKNGDELFSMLYWKHWYLFDALFSYAPLSRIGMDLVEWLGDGWEFSVWKGQKNSELFLHHREWYKFYKDDGGNDIDKDHKFSLQCFIRLVRKDNQEENYEVIIWLNQKVAVIDDISSFRNEVSKCLGDNYEPSSRGNAHYFIKRPSEDLSEAQKIMQKLLPIVDEQFRKIVIAD